MANGTTGYYISDYRGSVVAITDATTSANITHKYQYDEFGNIVQKEETDENAFRYVGKYGVMYASDNLYYMRARFYDPAIGRFLSEDPIWSTNLYPYADNNPVMGIDPKGQEGEFIQALFLFEEKILLKRTSNTVLRKDGLTNEDGIDIILKQTFSTTAKLTNNNVPGVSVLTNAAYSVGKDLGKTGYISDKTVVGVAKDVVSEIGVFGLASVFPVVATNPYIKTATKEVLKTGGELGEKYLGKIQDDYIFPFLDKNVGTILFPEKFPKK
jgi:RHS repeat-associated protein